MTLTAEREQEIFERLADGQEPLPEDVYLLRDALTAAKAENERLREQVRAGIVNVFQNLNDGWWSIKIDYGRGDAARKHMRALADILYGDRAALSKPQEDTAAMTNPPEWAIKQVENALDNQGNNESIVQSFARALVETAERVERETIERCAEVSEMHEGKPMGHANGWTADQRDFYDIGQVDATLSVARQIRSLPRQYKETDNG